MNHICFKNTGIPASGLPTPTSGWNADFADLFEISVAAYKSPNDGVWKYAISSHDAHVGSTHYADMSVTPPDEGLSESIDSVERGNGPVIVSPEGPLVLLRKRVVKRGVNSMSHLKAYDGLMLWIRRTGQWRGDHATRGW